MEGDVGEPAVSGGVNVQTVRQVEAAGALPLQDSASARLQRQQCVLCDRTARRVLVVLAAVERPAIRVRSGAGQGQVRVRSGQGQVRIMPGSGQGQVRVILNLLNHNSVVLYM